jgi:hypothetical protein
MYVTGKNHSFGGYAGLCLLVLSLVVNTAKKGVCASLGLIRWCGIAAILGGVLGIVLMPILSYLWATYSDLYGYFGRAYFLVFLGCLWGLVGLYASRRENPGTQATEKPSEENLIIGMTFVGLAMAFVGSILDYWGGGSGEGFTQVQITGYGFEMTGLLLVVLGSFLLGLHYRRANVVPALVAWLLIAAGPGGILLSLVHIPSGAMLLFCCTWMVLGYLLLTGRILPAQPPMGQTTT